MRNWIRNCLAGAALTGSLMVTQLASAAITMVIKVGDIRGESIVANHANEIDITSYSWGVVQSNARVGGSPAGKSTVNALTFTKYVDASSPELFIDAAQGTQLKQAQLTLIKIGGGTPNQPARVEMVKIKLDNVMVASVTSGLREGSSDRPVETITLVFTALEYTYTPQKADGSNGAPVTVKWNAASGTRM